MKPKIHKQYGWWHVYLPPYCPYNYFTWNAAMLWCNLMNRKIVAGTK